MTVWRMVEIVMQALGFWLALALSAAFVYLVIRHVFAWHRDECLLCDGRGFEAEWRNNRAPRKCARCQGTCEYRFPLSFGALWR